MRVWILHRLKREWQHLQGAYDRWTRDDGALMAAAVAYYVGLSFFPVLLVLIAGFGMFLRFTQPGQNAEEQLLQLVATNFSPALQQRLAEALSLVQERSTFTGPMGLATILLASMAGFVQFERAFDRIWGVPQSSKPGVIGAIQTVLLRRGVAFLLLLSMGLLIVTIFIAGLVLTAVEGFANEIYQLPAFLWGWARTALSLVLNAAMFTLLYRWLSKVKVRWREALRGGVLASILWEVGREVLALFLVKTSYGSAYGVIGSFVAILLWCYYAVGVIFFGAEYIQEFCRGCDDASSGYLNVGAEADDSKTM